VFGVGDAVAGFQKLVPERGEGAHLAELGHEADAGIDKKRHSARHRGEVLGRNLHFQIIQHRAGGSESEGQFLFRCGPRLLQVVAADVHRVPLRQMRAGIGGDIGDEPKRGFGRQDVGAARQVFLDDVVLHRPLQGGDHGALFFGHRDV
jgi:hypothetical protein